MLFDVLSVFCLKPFTTTTLFTHFDPKTKNNMFGVFAFASGSLWGIYSGSALWCTCANLILPRLHVQETTLVWRARFNSCAPWATTSFRFTSRPALSSLFRGWASGWIGMRRPRESPSASPPCSRWPPWCLLRTPRYRRSPTSSRSTSIWARASWWCLPAF